MRFLFLALTLLLSASVFSQQTVSTPKQKQIIKMMELAGTKKVLDNMKVTLKDSYKKNFPDVDEKFWDDYFNGMTSDGLIELIVPIYDKHFTEADINGIIAFYETPIGRKMIEKLPLIMQESMAAGQQWGLRIGQQVQEKMKSQGGQ